MPTRAHAPLTLYTFAMSHYSEKIRWTLDACDIPYREVCLSPAFHIGPALRMGGHGQTTLPIIQGDGYSVQDSPRILTWLQSNRGPLAVMPLAMDTAVRQVEQRFNAIGKDVARYLYAGSFGVAYRGSSLETVVHSVAEPHAVNAPASIEQRTEATPDGTSAPSGSGSAAVNEK